MVANFPAIRTLLAIAPLVVPGLVPATSAQEVVTIENVRPGVSIKYLFLPAGGIRLPAAAVVLLPGGNGVLGLTAGNPIPTGLMQNFLIRSRHLFANNGLYVAALDAASDHATGLTMSYRLEPEHAQDIRRVVADVRMRTGKATWLVGTSSGTLSVANTAALGLNSGPDLPHGIVLTSTLTHKSLGCPKAVTDASLSSIKLPTLIVSHRGDACACTPSVDSNALLALFTTSPAKQVSVHAGGTPPQSAPCEASSQHGFFGIEGTVVNSIASWIRSHSPGPIADPGATASPKRK